MELSQKILAVGLLSVQLLFSYNVRLLSFCSVPDCFASCNSWFRTAAVKKWALASKSRLWNGLQCQICQVS